MYFFQTHLSSIAVPRSKPDGERSTTIVLPNPINTLSLSSPDYPFLTSHISSAASKDMLSSTFLDLELMVLIIP